MLSRRLAATAALLAALAACSGNDGEAADDRPAAGPGTSGAPTRSASPAPVPADPMALGEGWSWKGEAPEIGPAGGETTALAYTQPVPGVSGPGGPEEEWASLEVEVCAEFGKIAVSRSPWSLAYEDGTRIEVARRSGGDFPEPGFPTDAIVGTGDCARGLLMFPVPEGERPEHAVYAPFNGETRAWALPAG